MKGIGGFYYVQTEAGLIEAKGRGIAGTMLNFACNKAAQMGLASVRIDTHADNKPMQRAIEKFGFVYCGIIKAHDGTPRIAFEKIEQAKVKQP